MKFGPDVPAHRLIRTQVADLRALADEHAAHAHDDDHRAEAALRSIAAHVSDDGDDAPAEVEGAERRAARASQGSKRERNSQLQRLRSRPFSTRFG